MTCHEKQFFEGTRGQEARGVTMWSEALLQGHQGAGGTTRNPEFLNSGMLVGEDPTLITGSRTPPP